MPFTTGFRFGAMLSLVGRYTLNTAGRSPAVVCTTRTTVMGKPVFVHLNETLPVAVGAPEPAKPGRAAAPFEQTFASRAAGNGFVNVAVSPGPRSSGGAPVMPRLANN